MSERGITALALVAALLGGAAILLAGQSAPRAQTSAPQTSAPQTNAPQADRSQSSAAVDDLAAANANASLPFTEIPFYADWASSPHADRGATAFNHWNSEGAIPTDCARCHSTPGFQDYLGADGTAAGVVDHPAPIGTVITCLACHNARTLALTSVTFPSGLKVDGLGADARCMVCHQGTESTNSVNEAVAGTDDDSVNPKLQFINVHYRAAAATMMGTLARVAYEYPGKHYVGRFEHQAPYNRCTTCHDPHTVAVKVTDCSACHKQITDEASLKLIRVSKTDFDGTGNADEGIAEEIDHLHQSLMAAIQLYAKTVINTAIVYNGNAYPYFFVDRNRNGIVEPGEAKVPNRFNAWTPRLLKAAYNYQFVEKDPGAFAHNPTYTIEILYDSLADLGQKVSVDTGKLVRP